MRSFWERHRARTNEHSFCLSQVHEYQTCLTTYTITMDPHPDLSESGNVNGNTMSSSSDHTPRSRTGWDGKLRVEKKPILVNPEALTDPEYSDEDAPPVEQIDADEGW